jgi:hypothetical protein
VRENETTARRVIAGEAEQPECGGHRGRLRCAPAVLRPDISDLDFDHYEGLDFHNAFDIRAPYS